MERNISKNNKIKRREKNKTPTAKLYSPIHPQILALIDLPSILSLDSQVSSVSFMATRRKGTQLAHFQGIARHCHGGQKGKFCISWSHDTRFPGPRRPEVPFMVNFEFPT